MQTCYKLVKCKISSKNEIYTYRVISVVKIYIDKAFGYDGDEVCVRAVLKLSLTYQNCE